MAKQTTSAAPTRSIAVKSAILVAVLGALGCILTFFAIPVGPDININLYVISGIFVGAVLGPWLGLLAGALGAAYTPVLWGWFGAIPYNAAIGLIVGLGQRFGIRPAISGVVAYIVVTPFGTWSAIHFLGEPFPVAVIGLGSTALQTAVCIVIMEGILHVPALKKRLPRTKMSPPGWVARSAWIRHPWVTAPEPTPVNTSPSVVG